MDRLTQQIRAGIQAFLTDRLQVRLDALAVDDPKRETLVAQYRLDVWLADAARRVGQIQAVTHALKPVHPEARGTNLYVEPGRLAALDVVGTHALGAQFESDVVGNAAALDVYKFLRLSIEGRSLLDWLDADDPRAVAALSDDPAQAKAWRDAFVALIQPRNETLASHAYGKQLYWLAGEDAADDGEYHLLVPLHPTSLQHAMHAVIQEHRFGEANKLARAARRERVMFNGVYHTYPSLAVRKLGGTKPQNVSQLNSERRGINYLLSSAPPTWTARRFSSPWSSTSVFDALYQRQEGVRSTVLALRRFLLSDPPPTVETRNRRDAYVDTLVDALVALAGALRAAWPVGWTADPQCRWVRVEQLWLDPERAAVDSDFRREWLAMAWPEQVGRRFANWLNQQLRDGGLSVGDIEHREWKRELLLDEEADGWARQLSDLHARVDSMPQSASSQQEHVS